MGEQVGPLTRARRVQCARANGVGQVVDDLEDRGHTRRPADGSGLLRPPGSVETSVAVDGGASQRVDRHVRRVGSSHDAPSSPVHGQGSRHRRSASSSRAVLDERQRHERAIAPPPSTTADRDRAGSAREAPRDRRGVGVEPACGRAVEDHACWRRRRAAPSRRAGRAGARQYASSGIVSEGRARLVQGVMKPLRARSDRPRRRDRSSRGPMAYAAGAAPGQRVRDQRTSTRSASSRVRRSPLLRD